MKIREVYVRISCPICGGRENGCYDCAGKGFFEEWISFKELLNEIEKDKK